MEFTMCRTMFCSKCLVRNHPKRGDKYLVYGSSSGDFYSKISKKKGVRGYTPHIIRFTDPLTIVSDQIVVLEIFCGICGADFHFEQHKGEWKLKVTPKEAKLTYVRLSDFNALLLKWSDSGYRLK